LIREGWNLPGPRRFADEIAEALESGQTALVLLPDRVADGLRGAVKQALAADDWRFLDVRVRDLASIDPLDALTQTWALPLDPRNPLNIESLLGQPELSRSILFLDLRSVGGELLQAWAAFLRQHAAASRERRLAERLVICALVDATGSDVLPEEDAFISWHWWWGRLNRLDTEVFLVMLELDRPLDPVFAASITEVSAFDLQLAEILADEWDGTSRLLQSLLTDYARHELHVEGAGRYAGPASDGRPPRQVLELWAEGGLNRWSELDPCYHAVLDLNTQTRELMSRVWRGQVRTLLPEIELERHRLAGWVMRNRRHLSDYWARQDIPELEIGPLCKLVGETAALRAQSEQWELVRWLRDTRNMLAHWRVADAGHLRTGRRLLVRARASGPG